MLFLRLSPSHTSPILFDIVLLHFQILNHLFIQLFVFRFFVLRFSYTVSYEGKIAPFRAAAAMSAVHLSAAVSLSASRIRVRSAFSLFRS